MGKASRRKQLAAPERTRVTPRRFGGGRSGLAWALGGLAATALVAFLVAGAARSGPARPPASGDSQLADSTLFATTGGQKSLADFRGSRLVIYFYEGVG